MQTGIVTNTGFGSLKPQRAPEREYRRMQVPLVGCGDTASDGWLPSCKSTVAIFI